MHSWLTPTNVAQEQSWSNLRAIIMNIVGELMAGITGRSLHLNRKTLLLILFLGSYQ